MPWQTTIRIWDFGGAVDVEDSNTLVAVMAKRYGAGVNTFWLSRGEGEYPLLAILVNGELRLHQCGWQIRHQAAV